MMKQAQQMQKKMAKIQEDLEKAEYEGEAGGGMIKVTINGKGQLNKLKIDPSLVADTDEVEMLEDLIVAAFNNAKKNADEASSSAMNDAMGGLQLPPGFSL